MLDPKKKLKKYVAAVILLLVLAASVSELHIQSVKHYKEEQHRLADDIIIADADSSATEVTGSTEVPDVSHSPEETETENVRVNSLTDKINSPTDKTNKENSTNATKSDTLSKQAPVPSASGQEKRGTANRQEKNQRKPQKTSATKTKATQKPSPIQAETKATQKPSPIPTEEQKNFVCGITIRCDSVLKHMDEVDDAVKSYIPADGIILGQTSVKVEIGDTAYSLLQKVCQAKDIALDASYTNAYSSAYVRGIGHIYEKQAGLSSGWLYLVNGKVQGYSASRYRLQEGDQIEWVYSCSGKLE